jgi:hypothetical protein
MAGLAARERTARADAEHNLWQAQESASETRARLEVLLLEGGNSLGLLDLLDAHRTAEDV